MKKLISSIILCLASTVSLAQVDKLRESNSIIFTNTTVESVKSSLMDRLSNKGTSFEERGNSIVATVDTLGKINSAQWIMLAYSFGGNTNGNLELVITYNFIKNSTGIKVTPTPVWRYTNTFGRSQNRVEPNLLPSVLSTIMELNPEAV